MRTWGSLLAVLLFLLPAPAATQAADEEPRVAAESELQAQGVKKFRKRRRPVQFGVSGGNLEDFELDPPFVFCSSGTLGALVVMDDGMGAGGGSGERYFVLSNNHVLARSNKAKLGEDITQPGNIDVDCDPEDRDLIGSLTGYRKLRFSANARNRVDAAIAELTPGTFRMDGKQLRIGVPGDAPVSAFVGQKVQKSGRTTGYTRGEVVDTSADFFVEFEVGTGSGAAVRDAFFVDQLVVQGRGGSSFSGGGDSGAVVYEDVRRCPRAVGLLFAGNGELTAVNPMADVLDEIDRRLKPKQERGEKRLVGCSATQAQEARIVTTEDRRVRRAVRIKERIAGDLLELPGVVGVGAGFVSPEDREVVVRVYVEQATEELRALIPEQVDGVRTVLVPGGKFRAY